MGLPLLNLLAADLRRKRPGTFYLMEESVERLRGTADEVIQITDPEMFAADGRYLLLELEREPD